jgi:hypothetical protein
MRWDLRYETVTMCVVICRHVGSQGEAADAWECGHFLPLSVRLEGGRCPESIRRRGPWILHV